MPKSVKQFSGDIMLQFLGIDHVHEFGPARPKLTVI
jgi:hypothetical protein